MNSSLSVGLVCPYSLSEPGGVQNHVLGLAAALRQQGHRPQILAPGIPAADVPVPASLVTGAGPGLPLRYNGSVARVNFGPRSAARVSAWLAEHRFDLLHLHEPITPSISLLALRAARSPVVATFHTATPGSAAMRVAGVVLDPLVRRIDVGLAVSSAAREVVRGHLGFSPEIVPNGIDVAQFAGPPVRTSIPRITLLGRLDEERKGLQVFLRALPEIRRQIGPVDVVVAGPVQHRLPSGIRRLGKITDAERGRLLRATDVFVAPNTARESFGLIVVEALAAGAKVVASDIAAFTEVLDSDGRAMGDTFSTGDPSALASVVAAALQAPDRPGARDHAARYDWSAVVGRIVDGYRSALGEPPMVAEIA